MGKLRELRQTVREALVAEPWPSGLAGLDAYPPKTLLGPLFACLLEPDALVRWRAASTFGPTVARLFAEKPEDARQLMRQLMWRLNEESGNIAWGVPEAFGEILAAQPALAGEFHRVLASYINERDCESGDTFIDHCPLRRGVYWALGRVSDVSPDLVLSALADLLKTLDGEDPESRGLAAYALGNLLPLAGDALPAVVRALAGREADGHTFTFYKDGGLSQVTVGRLAGEALKKAP